jgi:hypothetical protein
MVNFPREPTECLAAQAKTRRAVVPASYGKTPRGLLYHTTQSHLAPFEESSNRQLRQLGRNLLELLRRERSYHYVIDRFGRVYRVVEESDAANHDVRQKMAGNGSVLNKHGTAGSLYKHWIINGLYGSSRNSRRAVSVTHVELS